jgi:hypothetical protein
LPQELPLSQAPAIISWEIPCPAGQLEESKQIMRNEMASESRLTMIVSKVLIWHIYQNVVWTILQQ